MRDEFNTDVAQEAEFQHEEILGYTDGLVGYTDGLVGADMEPEQAALYATIGKLRDNRRPAPAMRAVAVGDEETIGEVMDECLIGMCGGADDAFPLTTSLLKEATEGAMEARVVRVDTEASYPEFRAQGSAEMAALQGKVAEIEQRLTAHLADPSAHQDHTPAGLQHDIETLHAVGAAAEQIEEAQRIPLSMPAHFNGLIEAWHDGDLIGATVILPGANGERLFATCAESVGRGQLEAARAATEAGVPAALIVGHLPGIGAVTGAANAIKCMVGGAESLLQRPEAQSGQPFEVVLKPKLSPALFAMAKLARLCAAGNAQACDEWTRLQANGPAVLKQAMTEIVEAMKPQPTAVGGWWHKILAFFGMGEPPTKAPPEVVVSKVSPAPDRAPAALPPGAPPASGSPRAGQNAEYFG